MTGHDESLVTVREKNRGMEMNAQI